ncbi:MAG: hypothetical protein ACLP8A_04160 [Methylovirgula sp.]
MGELVVFKPKKVAPRQPMAEGAGAEILFFTGVRIVRCEAIEEPVKQRRRRATARTEAPRKRRERS